MRTPNSNRLLTQTKTRNIKIAELMLRIGLAVIFIYASISAFKIPNAWISYIPDFTTHLIPAKVSLDIISVVQLILAVVLLSGRWLKYAAIVSMMLLIGITVFNLNTLLITFRDIGLFFAAVALYFLA
ncbi:MAG: hypothetical protein NVSMB46_03860 [Candidatus Saccharimonadales bacterium]